MRIIKYARNLNQWAIRFLLILLLLAQNHLFSAYAHEISDEVGHNNSPDVNACMQELGQYLYSNIASEKITAKFLKSVAPMCIMFESDKYINLIFKTTAIRFGKKHFETFSPEKRSICLGHWNSDWKSIFIAASNKNDTGKFLPTPLVPLSKLENEIYLRAKMDERLSALIIERKAFGGLSEDNCYTLAINSGLIRGDNHVFFIRENLFKKLLGGKINPQVYPALWLMVHHADLTPEFQDKGLTIFKEASTSVNFPKKLVKYLENRIKARKVQ